MVRSPFQSRTSRTPLAFFKKGGEKKARPIFGKKPRTLLGTPQRTGGISGGAVPKGRLGRLTVDVAKRGAGFGLKKAREFKEAQKEQEELQEELGGLKQETKEAISNLRDIEVDEDKDVQVIQQTVKDPVKRQRKIQKVRKEADEEEEKQAKKLEKKREEEKKVTKQLKANEDRLNQIALILKPSAFKVK